MNSQRKTKNLSIELLRIFSMLLITLWHAKVHFVNNIDSQETIVSNIFNYVVMFINFHVNTFVLITGFYGVRDNIKGIIRTVLLVFFYSVVLSVFTYCILGKLSFANMLLPFSHGSWWFMQIYIVLLVIAPVIERFISDCSRREYLSLLFGVLIVDVYLGFFNHVNSLYFHGYDIINFVAVYMLGIWIRKDGLELVERLKSPKLYLFIFGIIAMYIQYKAMGFNLNVDISDYNSPYAIVMSVIAFLFFYKLHVPTYLSNIILFLSTSAIAVYLITDFPEIKEVLLPYFTNIMQPHLNSLYGVIMLVVLVTGAYLCSCVIDKLRIPITNCIERILLNKL